MSDGTALVIQLIMDVVILGTFLAIAIINGSWIAWALFGSLVLMAIWGLG
jgi:hypothetical protein